MCRARDSSDGSRPKRPFEGAVLLVSEVVSNAVQHAGGPTRVTVSPHPSRRLLVTVSDASPVLPGAARAGTGLQLGLQLLKALSTRWGAHTTPHGKLVWFEFYPAS